MQNNFQKGGVLVWILVIIVVVGSIFLFVKKNRAGDYGIVESNATLAKEKTITYDANGFSPNVITIAKGGAVVFQNKTGKLASVASGPHPTHLKYPEFDQYKTDQRGKDEFRFVFEKVGSWGYHDHLNANMTGTVIVTK